MNLNSFSSVVSKVVNQQPQTASAKVQAEEYSTGQVDGIDITQVAPGPPSGLKEQSIDAKKVTGNDNNAKHQITLVRTDSSNSLSSVGSDYSFLNSVSSKEDDSHREEESTTPLLGRKKSLPPTASNQQEVSSSTSAVGELLSYWSYWFRSSTPTSPATQDASIGNHISIETVTPEQIQTASLQQLSDFTVSFKMNIESLSKQEKIITGAECQKNISLFEAALRRRHQIRYYHLIIDAANENYNPENTYKNDFKGIQKFKLSEEDLKILDKVTDNLEAAFGTLSVSEDKSAPSANRNSGKNFKATYKSIIDAALSGWVLDLHSLFKAAVQQDSKNEFYTKTLEDLARLMSPEKDVAAANNDSMFDANKVELARIEAVLTDSTKLKKVTDSNPENPTSCVNALDVICEKDPSLIIAAGEVPQKESVQQNIEEKKSAWSAVQFWHWLTRSPEDKIRYRAGIMAARTHVESKYGSPAVKRFDAHFALRYRTGSPLTVRALNAFVLHEEGLIGTKAKVSTAVVSLNLDNNTKLDDLSGSILDRAKYEFDLRYYCQDSADALERPNQMKLISKEDKAVLFANFYQHYLERSVAIEEKIPKKIAGEEGVGGFFTTRWNAFRTSIPWFRGDNSRANQELQTKLTDWIIRQVPETAKTLTEEKISSTIKGKLKTQNRLTLQDLENLIIQAESAAQENNTWTNFFYYRLYAPVVGTAAKAVGAAAAIALVANESSLGKGAAKAAALGAALYALDDRPGMQLSTALAAWWAAKNTNTVNAAGGSILGIATGLAKNAAIAFAGMHFPPLWLLYAL